MPLAVLGKLPETLGLTDGLAPVVRQLAERLESEATGDQADRLLTAAYILTGLRFQGPIGNSAATCYKDNCGAPFRTSNRKGVLRVLGN